MTLLTLLALLLCALVHAPRATAQTGDVLTQLLEQARRWQAKGRLDKAAEAYEKVLRSRPEDPEALEALGLWHAQAGRSEQAQKLLTLLARVAPNSEAVARLTAALSVGKGQDALIAEARTQVRARDLEHAVATYRRAFGGDKPPHHLALEYYQTLGGTEHGWEPARRGFEQLLKEKPGWSEARLALARHLTYRESARREGIDQLRELSVDPNLHAEALSAWRKALVWLQASREDAPRFSHYLEQAGEDPELRARLAELTQNGAASQRGVSARAGYEALDREDIEEASRQFARAGDAPEGLVGMALVAMRKDDFELAVKLLESASARAPARQELWGEPLKSARFWSQVKRAEKLAGQDPAQSERLLRDAATIAPEQAHHAHIALAALLRKGGRKEAAEQELQKALASQPDEPLVLRALLDLALERDDYESALALNARIGEKAPDHAWPPAQLEAEVLRRRAQERHARGELAQTGALLSEAARLAPESYWIVYDQANLALELGELAKAREGVERLSELGPNEPSVRVLRARIEAEQGRPEAALELLAGLPPSAAEGQVGKLRDQLELSRELDRAVRTSAQHGTYSTRRELMRLQQRAGDQPALLGQVALAWAEVGDAERGVELLQQLLAAQHPPSHGTMLQLAAVYLRAERDDELRQLLEELASDPSLSSRARRDLAQLHVAFAVGSADRLARTGDYERALRQLDPLLAEYPDNPSLLSGLGRLFLNAGDHAQATATFQQVLRRDPGNLEARDGAVSAALAQGQRERARELVELGLRAHPRSARMQLIAARYELARGDDAAAMRALTKAQGLTHGSGGPGAPGKTDGSIMVASDSRGLVRAARAQLAADPLSPGQGKALAADIDREIEQVRARHAVAFALEPQLRHRNGERGLGRLSELRLPLTLGVPIGYFGRVEVGAEAVYLNAGEAALDRPDLASRFGALGSVPAVADKRAQDDAGIAPKAAFAYRDRLRLELGTTPLGFLYRSIVGALNLRLSWGAWTLTLRGERKAVTDSLLSYAGTTDPLTGHTWGGVVAQGGSLEIAVGDEQRMFYLTGAFHYLTGHRVPDNRVGRVALGLLWTLYDWEGHSVRFGATALGMAYQNDQLGFTYGLGGYFSPEWFARGGAPLSYRFANDRLNARVELDPGINWFRTERTDYYPRAGGLQLQREALGLPASFGGKDNLGFSLNGTFELRYRVARAFALGAQASMHFANDYEEYRAGLFGQVTFNRRLQSTGAGR